MIQWTIMQGLSQAFKIETFEIGPMQNLIYLIWDIKTKKAAIVDPAWDLSSIYLYTVSYTHLRAHET